MIKPIASRFKHFKKPTPKRFTAQSLKNLFYRIYTKRVFIYAALGAAVVGVYIGFLLVGDSSLETLLHNISEKNELSNIVKDLQTQNAKLQKDLFELKGLEP